MKKTKYISIFMWLIVLGCSNPKENNTESDSTKIKISKPQNQGDCFINLKNYKPDEKFEFIKYNIYQNLIDSTFHYSTCDSDGFVYLKQLDESIHIESIEDLGEFWVDRSNVYYKYTTSDGIQIVKLEIADRESFRTFGKTIYAKDEEHIYDSRHGIIEEADLETFNPIRINEETGISVYGKDKNNFFFWDELIEDTIEFKNQLKIE